MIARDRSGLYVLPDLPFNTNALEPHIDARTMEIHHDKHHGTYTSKLNDAIRGHADLLDMDIVTLLANLDRVPEAIRSAVRNHGGGTYNHALFWQLLTPGGGSPEGDILRAIQRDFGDVDTFRSRFGQAAETRFGSGWAWLVTDRQGHLSIGSTANQDNPLMHCTSDINGIPILGLDVWEHAYYLNYQNRRPDYIKAWWNVVNWRKVNELFLNATR